RRHQRVPPSPGDFSHPSHPFARAISLVKGVRPDTNTRCPTRTACDTGAYRRGASSVVMISPATFRSLLWVQPSLRGEPLLRLHPRDSVQENARRWVRPLAVNCQEVVRGHQVTHGRSTVKRAVATLPIVVVQPGGQRLGALSGAGIGAAVRPLAQQGLDKPLGLAVGARGIGPRTEVAHA